MTRITSSLSRISGSLAALGAALALLTGGLVTDASAASDDDQVVVQFLGSTGADADGTARARWRDKGDGTFDFSVELEDLAPGSYELYVTDLSTPRGSISVDGTGEGEIEFETPLDGSKPLFDFAVFGEPIDVRQGETVFFSDTFGAGGGGGGTAGKTKTEVFLVNVGPDFDAKGRMKYEAKGAKTRFAIEVEKLDAGTFIVRVDGVPVAEITTTSSASVEVEFQDPIEPGKTLLNFDPLGAQVDVLRDGTVYLAGVLPGADSATGTTPPSKAGKGAKDLGKAAGDALLVPLSNTGVVSGAMGTARLSQSGEMELEVELHGVPAGVYELCVSDVTVGNLQADTSGHAELEFSTAPVGSQQLLDFDVKGQLIAVKDSRYVILSAVFPTSVQAALGKFKKELSKPGRVRVNLVNAGVDLDATGTADWRLKGNGGQELRLDVRDLPAGTYHIVVDGVPSAFTLTVPASPATGKGKLVFATVAKGSKVPFDFDPVDALVQITDAVDAVVLQALIDVP